MLEKIGGKNHDKTTHLYQMLSSYNDIYTPQVIIILQIPLH